MNRLRSYRGLEQVTQAQLGERLGISQALVSDYESGRRSATCDLGLLGYSNDRFHVAEMTEPLHRALAATRVDARRRAKELLRLSGEVMADLRSLREHPIRLHSRPLCDDEIADLAADVRMGVLGVEESGPIRNLTTAVEWAGVCLVPLTRTAGIDGLSAWVKDHQQGGHRSPKPVIGLRADVPGERFRMSLAHEIGHLVMHSKPSSLAEDEAFRFASMVLFPPEDFDVAMNTRARRPLTIRDFQELKASWGVSVKALVLRAHKEGYLDDRRYRSMQIQMSKWRNREPASFPIAPGKMLSDLFAHHGGYRSVAESFGYNNEHLRQLVDWPATHLRIASSSPTVSATSVKPTASHLRAVQD